MGVVAMSCDAAGERFLKSSRDVPRAWNGDLFQLRAGIHRNRLLQELWDARGEEGFTYEILSELEYDQPADVRPSDLEELLEICLLEHPEARRL